jgi:hypothetical protein
MTGPKDKLNFTTLRDLKWLVKKAQEKGNGDSMSYAFLKAGLSKMMDVNSKIKSLESSVVTVHANESLRVKSVSLKSVSLIEYIDFTIKYNASREVSCG